MRRTEIALLCVLLVGLGVAQGPRTSAAASFPDLAEHWAAPYVANLVTRGVINGYPDGTFRPENTVTRAEFVKMLAKAVELGPVTDLPATFPDVQDHWIYRQGYFEAAIRARLLHPDDYWNGLSAALMQPPSIDSLFSPDRGVSRLEMAICSVRALGLESLAEYWWSSDPGFTDTSDCRHYWGHLKAAKMTKVITGFEDGSFNPGGTATRAQAATILCKLLEAREDPERLSSLPAIIQPGDSCGDELLSVCQAEDGGFVLAGKRTGEGGLPAAWFVRTDVSGQLVWSKEYGSDSSWLGTCIAREGEGFVVAGQALSSMAWFDRLSDSGSLAGTPGFDNQGALKVTAMAPRGGDGWVLAAATSEDAYLNVTLMCAIDQNGERQWVRTLEQRATAYDIDPLPDGGFVLAGARETRLGYEGWAAKVDQTGAVVWSSGFQSDSWAGETSCEAFFSAEPSGDGYVFVGQRCPPPGDHVYALQGWLLKTDSSGKTLWQKSFDQRGDVIRAASDGGFIVAGRRSGDAVVFKVSDNGTEQWQKTFKGNEYAYVKDLIVTVDGGYALLCTDGSGAPFEGGATLILLTADGSVKMRP